MSPSVPNGVEPPRPADLLPLTNLAFNILVALGNDDRHGYAIIKEIEERSAGTMTVRSGTLYTALQRLHTAGLVQESGERPAPDRDDQRRRYYCITELGREVVSLEATRLSALIDAARDKQLIRATPGN
jgi:DNA-binding PadR family transcriptional regulator